MRIVKIILVVGILIFVLLSLGLFIFLKTLDINRYKDAIAGHIGESLGRQVQIKDISFKASLSQGVTLGISSFNIQGLPQFTDDSLFYVDSARLNIDIVSLILKRQIFISEIEFDSPRINIVKNSDGELNIQHLKKDEQAAIPGVTAASKDDGAKSQTDSERGSELAFGDMLIRSIRISDGTVLYTDKSSTPPVVVPVSMVDLSVTNLSFDSAVPFKASALLWSTRPNIEVNGMVKIKAKGELFRIDDLNVQTDLSDLNFDLVSKNVPDIEKNTLPRTIKGLLQLTIQQMVLGEDGLLVFSSEGKWSDGLVEFAQYPVPLEHIDMRFDITDTDVEIKRSTMNLASGTVNVAGRVIDYLGDQNFVFDLDADHIQLSELIKPFVVPFKVEGQVVAKHSVKGKGFTDEAIRQFMTGDGELSVKDGKVIDINILKFVLSKISFIPNLGNLIEQNLPEKYKEKLKQKDTVLEEVTFNTNIRQGAVNINEAVVSADGFKTIGQGKIDFQQNATFRADFFIPKDFSDSLVASAPEFSYLLNDLGQVQIPLTPYSGPMSKFHMYPDVSHVGGEIIKNKGKEELRKAIFKALDLEQAPPDGQTETGDQNAPSEQKEPSPEEKAIENILDLIPVFK